MKRAPAIACAILAVGNALLWTRLSEASAESVARIARELHAACLEAIPVGMTEQHLEPSPLLPRAYALLASTDRSAALMSVYVAWFERDGAGRIRVHDPELCYATAGWMCTDRGTFEFTTDAGGASTIQRHAFRRGDGTERVVLSWKQPCGSDADTDESWWHRSLRKLVTGRSDFLWVRIELDARSWELPETRAATARRLNSLTRALTRSRTD